MAHEHLVYDTDPYFSIDPDTRVITCESDNTPVLILNDHNSERFTFSIPREVDGHDMSVCNRVEVHYINTDGTQVYCDVYEADDLRADPEDPEHVIFTWLISQNATRIVGSLNFAIRYACITSDGLIDYAWSTKPYTEVKVSNGIDNGLNVVDQNADVLEHWRISYEQAGGIAVADVEAARDAAVETVENTLENAQVNFDAMIDRIEGTLNLLPGAWDSNKEQTVTVAGVSSDSGVFFTPLNKAQRTLAAAAGLFVTVASNNSLVFSVDAVPTEVIKLRYYIMKVNTSTNEVTT